MKLTPDFSLAEFRVTSQKIENNVPHDYIPRLKCLCSAILQPLRDKLGSLEVTSGFRTERVNEMVGGSPSSQHVQAEAADIKARSASPDETWLELLRMGEAGFPIDQAIYYIETTGHIHVSHTTRKKNRNQFMAKTKNGKYIKWKEYDDARRQMADISV